MENQREFADEPQNLVAVRQFVRDVLDGWGIGVGAARDELLLLTSEVAANAIEYAQGPFTVSLRADARRARVEIRDSVAAFPTLRSPRPDAERGRGLMLVDRLATAWGADPEPSGKVVWFEVPLGADAPLPFADDMDRLGHSC